MPSSPELATVPPSGLPAPLSEVGVSARRGGRLRGRGDVVADAEQLEVAPQLILQIDVRRQRVGDEERPADVAGEASAILLSEPVAVPVAFELQEAS